MNKPIESKFFELNATETKAVVGGAVSEGTKAIAGGGVLPAVLPGELAKHAVSEGTKA